MGDSVDEQLAEYFREFYDDPLGFVLAMWNWGEGDLLHETGPDKWQRKFLEDLGAAVRARGFDGKTPVKPIRMAVSSGHGIGKSTLSAWVIWWVMCTRPKMHGICTSTTQTQLNTRLWAAVRTWYKRSAVMHRWFDTNTERAFHRDHRDDWFVIPQTCKEENAEAFHGQHASSSTSLYLFDEASAVPDSVFTAADGGLTDGEPIFLLFGNPTKNVGKFHQYAFEGDARWDVRVIDSRDSERTNKEELQGWIDEYGEDSDVVRYKVYGLPPRSSAIQFIDKLRVREAKRRPDAIVLDGMPLLCGLDVSRGGSAFTVFRFRRGSDARSIPPIRIPGEHTLDTTRVVEQAIAVLDGWWDGRKVDRLFVDETGVGGAIKDQLCELGYRDRVIGVDFSGASPDRAYGQMRAYLWGQMREWLRTGAVDQSKELESGLTGPGYHHNKRGRIVLEPKDKMEDVDGLDDADALAVTFHPRSPKKAGRKRQVRSRPPAVIHGYAGASDTGWMGEAYAGSAAASVPWLPGPPGREVERRAGCLRYPADRRGPRLLPRVPGVGDHHGRALAA